MSAILVKERKIRMDRAKEVLDELRARGLERVRDFSWDETARRTVEVYREAAG